MINISIRRRRERRRGGQPVRWPAAEGPEGPLRRGGRLPRRRARVRRRARGGRVAGPGCRLGAKARPSAAGAPRRPPRPPPDRLRVAPNEPAVPWAFSQRPKAKGARKRRPHASSGTSCAPTSRRSSGPIATPRMRSPPVRARSSSGRPSGTSCALAVRLRLPSPLPEAVADTDCCRGRPPRRARERLARLREDDQGQDGHSARRATPALRRKATRGRPRRHVLKHPAGGHPASAPPSAGVPPSRWPMRTGLPVRSLPLETPSAASCAAVLLIRAPELSTESPDEISDQRGVPRGLKYVSELSFSKSIPWNLNLECESRKYENGRTLLSCHVLPRRPTLSDRRSPSGACGSS